MSKLVLNGDTSGSVTLDAPAVSGTTTLTLPTTTGTLVVTSGAQTIEFADGSASTPSITNSGDTNTGIFFPAADTIAFAEGGVEAMRIDSSANFKFNSGYGSVATAYGCRAWVNFKGTGTVAIRASGNVSSITDNAVADFTVKFTTAMPDVNFCANIAATGPVSTQHCVPFIGSAGSNDTSGFPNTSSFRFSQYNVTNSGLRADAVVLCVSIFR